MGTPPPTRPVAAGNMEMNQHISKVSDFIEPVVDTFECGLEIIRTEDMLVQIDLLNKKMETWTPFSWWEGVSDNKFQSCGKCIGNEKVEYVPENPELCSCTDNLSPSPITPPHDPQPSRTHI